MKSHGFRVFGAPALLLAVGLCTGLAHAQSDRTWNNPAGGDWSNDANWNGGQPDTPLENAVIALAGPYTVTLGADRTISSISLVSAGSTLALSNAVLTMIGSHTQDGMTLTGNPSSTVAVFGTTTLRNATLTDLPAFSASGSLLFDGPGDTRILNSRLTHAGTTGTWQGTGNIIFGGGAGASGLTLGSASIFTIANDQTASWNDAGTRPDITNAGTLVKSGGTGVTSFLGVALNNTGTVRASTGTLRFDTIDNIAEGVLVGGTWRVDDNASLDLVDQAILANRAVVELSGENSSFDALDSLQLNDIPGTLRLLDGRMFTTQGSFINAGQITLDAGSAFRVPDDNGFTLTGAVAGAGQTSVLLTEGAATLQGGSLSGITYMSTGSLLVTGGTPLLVDDTCFDHSGFGFEWNGAGGINVGGGSSFSFGQSSMVEFSNQQTMSWNNMGARPTLTFENTLVKTGAGTTTSIIGVELANAGFLTVESGALFADTVQNIQDGILIGGSWEVKNNATLDFGSQVINSNAATVILEGPNAAFDAFAGVSNNTSKGVFELANGAVFVTESDFTNDGVVSVIADTAPTLFKINPGSTLTNYDPGTQTLNAGTFIVSGTGRDSATIEIDGLDIATLNGAVTLDGPGANVIDPTQSGDQNALRNLAVIGNAGSMAIANGKNFDTIADLRVAENGELGVGPDSTFNVNGNLVNFDSTGALSDGSYFLSGALRANNAQLLTLAAKVVLDGEGRLERPDGTGGFTDALPTMTTIAPEGDLTLQNGRSLTLLPHTLDTAPGSSLTIGMPAKAPGDTFLRVQGDFKHAGALSLLQGGELRIDGSATSDGVVRGDGSISVPPGQVFINNGLIEPGIPVGMPGADPTGVLRISGRGDLIINDPSVIRIDIFALGIGTGHDQLRVDGRMLFDDDMAGRLEVIVDPSYVPVEGDTFEILRFDGGSEGWFEELIIPSFFEQVREDTRFVLVVLPAPGTGALLMSAGLLAIRRRR